MNYLAHAVLSFGNEAVITGNMISDFVKGRKQFDYPDAIRTGITLHRLIDNYTDTHAATRAAMDVFRPEYRLYSGAFVDIVYDHFLARQDDVFLPSGLEAFAAGVYDALEHNRSWLPQGFAAMFPYMKQHNWLLGYRQKEGIEKSFSGLVRRAAYMDDPFPAIRIFRDNYQLLEHSFRQFWADVRPFAAEQLRALREQVRA